MSGHSKWSTIKRQKEVNDMAKGKIFSKLSRAITIAAKSGGPDPEGNAKLRIAIDSARAANMPKDNIERAISKAKGSEELIEVVYEGFLGGGVGVIVEAATDNRNRTAQEMKSLFEKNGGNMGGPGSVSFNFKEAGMIAIKKGHDADTEMLTIIDSGADDIEEEPDAYIIFTTPESLSSLKTSLESQGMVILSSEVTMRPITTIQVNDSEIAKKLVHVLDLFENHDDVQRVYTNADIQAEI